MTTHDIVAILQLGRDRLSRSSFSNVAQMVTSRISPSIAGSPSDPCKISTEPFYSPDAAAEYCRRSRQGLPLPLSHSGQSDRASDVHHDGHPAHRLSPSSEAESKPLTGGQTRRRIAVAVRILRTLHY